MRYKIALQQSDEGYSVSASGLPGCWSQGKTEAEALANIEAAIREYLSVVEDLLEDAESPTIKEIGMSHPIYRVVFLEIQAPYTLRVCFDDGSDQVIDFEALLEGELFGPLRGASLFGQVQIDPEVHTLVWPNGADWDPLTLHDWPERLPGLQRMAERWSRAGAETKD